MANPKQDGGPALASDAPKLRVSRDGYLVCYCGREVAVPHLECRQLADAMLAAREKNNV